MSLLVGFSGHEDILLPNTSVSSCCFGGVSHHNSYVSLVVYRVEGAALGITVTSSLICKSLFGAVKTALPI